MGAGHIMDHFPPDIESPFSTLGGDAYKRGTYTDEWGCVFENIQTGVMDEVKHPIVRNLSDIDKVKPPYKFLEKTMGKINESRRKSDKFIVAGGVNPFERMQFLRGTVNLFIDIMNRPPEFFELRDIVHEYNLKAIRIYAQTDADGIMFWDDWGSQNSLLIAPVLWRKLFEPLYRQYCAIIHDADKFVFMHSDECIFDILENLIEIGVDTINSQLFCMNIEAIGKKFKGRITFWGEIDRQRILVSKDTEDARLVLQRVKRALYDDRGGVIAACEFSAGTRPENVEAVFEEWEKK